MSDRERDVLALVADGLTDQEIVAALTLSPHTAHRHVANIRTKLGVSTRAAVAAAATAGCSTDAHLSDRRIIGAVARGEHPRRTPLYGALLLVAVWWAGAAVTLLHAPTAVKVAVLIVAVPVALVGFGMTFRDLS